MRFSVLSVVALAGAAFALPTHSEDKRGIFTLQGDLIDLDMQLNGLHDSIQNFRGDQGDIPEMQKRAEALYDSLEKTASDATNTGKIGPFFSAIGFGEISGAAPKIINTIQLTVDKKPQYTAAGAAALVKADIIKLHQGLDDFGKALLAIADQSVVPQGQALLAKGDAAFATAEAAYADA